MTAWVWFCIGAWFGFVLLPVLANIVSGVIGRVWRHR